MINIRFANQSDMKQIVCTFHNKRISWATPHQAALDIKNKQLLVIEVNGKIVGSCALVYDYKYNYLAIKRLFIYNKNNLSKGYASLLINFIIKNTTGNLGLTPWVENQALIRMIEKKGFKFQYHFRDKYLFYLLKR